MNAKTTIEQRKLFYGLHQQEQGYEEIAERFCVSKECVRYWCRKQRDGQKVDSQSREWAKRGSRVRIHPKVRFVILRFKLKHRKWGPNCILTYLRERTSLQGITLPSRASIGRYLHQFPRFGRKKKAPPKGSRPNQPVRVHQRWQIDFKVCIRLKNGQMVNLHTVRDPLGEACMGAYVYLADAEKPSKNVPMEDVRTTFRNCFETWRTLPEEIQTDGEPALIGKPEDNFPTIFTLWLIGLGIRHIVIRPGKPTDNAEVERCHQTINNYALIGNEQLDLDALQEVLNQAVHDLAYKLTSQAKGCAGKTPIAAHPELLSSPRPYHHAWEENLFDLSRVDAYLSTFIWDRKVGTNGTIFLGGERYSLGREKKSEMVKVRFDPSDRNFVCFQLDEKAQIKELKRWPARHWDKDDFLSKVTVSWPVGLGPQQLALPLDFKEGVIC